MAAEELSCPECLTGEAHSDPAEPHIHLTSYGYLLYSPDHPRPDFIEEVRECGRRYGREEAARAILEHAGPLPEGAVPDARRRALLTAARIAAPKPTAAQIAEALTAGNYALCVLDDAGRATDPQQKGTDRG